LIDKTVRTAAEAMEGIADGATILVGGFGKVG
jgi:3-oxoadipate CoA-transferase alpha subunit